MKISDVIIQLRRRAPQLTDLFTDEISITGMGLVSPLVIEVTTAVPHGQIVGNTVNIEGALEENVITSLTRVGSTVTAVTGKDHDLTVPSAQQIRNNDLRSFNQAVVVGVDQPEYNGTFIITGTPSRKSFTYEIIGTPVTPATGFKGLRIEGIYNGEQTVSSVIDTVTFQFTTSVDPTSPNVGTAILKVSSRISGALSFQRALNSYTQQSGTDQLWCFIVPDDDAISRNRGILADATQELAPHTEFRVKQIESVFAYVFMPAVGDLTGIGLQATAQDIQHVLYKSLLGLNLATGLSAEPTWSLITPLGNRFVEEASTSAFYIYEYNFERIVEVVYKDTVADDPNTNFNNVSISFGLPEGTGVEKVTSDFNLD